MKIILKPQEVYNLIRENKIPRLYVFELLENIYWYSLEKLDFFWIQWEKNEEKTFILVFDMLCSKAIEKEEYAYKLMKLIKKIK